MNRRIGTFVLSIGVLAALAGACGDGGGDGADTGSPLVGSSDDGVAGDAVAEVLEGTDMGEVLDAFAEGEDVEEALGDLMESAEAAAQAFSEDGSGSITVNGEEIRFASELCFVDERDFSIDGLGSAPDGTPVWVSISHTDDSREEMLEYMDEDVLEMLRGDAERIINSTVAIDYGRTELFGDSPDDQPSFNGMSGEFAGEAQIELTVSGDSVSGGGMVTDYNNVAGDWDTVFPVEVQAACG